MIEKRAQDILTEGYLAGYMHKEATGDALASMRDLPDLGMKEPERQPYPKIPEKKIEIPKKNEDFRKKFVEAHPGIPVKKRSNEELLELRAMIAKGDPRVPKQYNSSTTKNLYRNLFSGKFLNYYK